MGRQPDLAYLDEDDKVVDYEDAKNKYVDLEKNIIFECIYNNKFKKWIPSKILNNNDIIISKKNLQNLLKNEFNNKF